MFCAPFSIANETPDSTEEMEKQRLQEIVKHVKQSRGLQKKVVQQNKQFLATLESLSEKISTIQETADGITSDGWKPNVVYALSVLLEKTTAAVNARQSVVNINGKVFAEDFEEEGKGPIEKELKAAAEWWGKMLKDVDEQLLATKDATNVTKEVKTAAENALQTVDSHINANVQPTATASAAIKTAEN